jgi:hypothetical protein
MKHLIARTLTSLSLAVLLLAGVVYAQPAPQVIRVKVPFEFVAGKHAFPAGEYSLVRTAPYLLVLRDAQGRTLATLITRSAESSPAPASAKLAFYDDGGQYRLAQVWQANDSIGQELYRPKANPVMARRRGAPIPGSAEASQP